VLTPRTVSFNNGSAHATREAAAIHDPFIDETHAGLLMPDGVTMRDLVRASLVAVPERKL
jgi:hypothetical protein